MGFIRSRSGTNFGTSGDGLDVIDDGTELSRVLNDPVARGKVVRSIKYCGGPTTNTIGCAWRPGNGMAAQVRYGNIDAEARLWCHEYGHNTGSPHIDDRRNNMNPILYSSNATDTSGLTQSQCTTLHNPSFSTYADISNDGQGCGDADGDGVQDGIDNCPGVPNFDQADSNNNGIGDACEDGCGNGLINDGEQCDGSNLNGQSCSTLNFDSGNLTCNPDCTFNITACEKCGQ